MQSMRMPFLWFAAFAIAVPVLPIASVHAQPKDQMSATTVKVEAGKPDASAESEHFKPEEQASKGSVTVGGQVINYDAFAGTLVVHTKDWDDVPQNTEKDAKTPEASMFYVAYFKSDNQGAPRPLTFLYNGGPGSSTVWLHMGAFGPKRVVTADDSHTPAAPYSIVNNDHSLLDVSDLVLSMRLAPASVGTDAHADPESVAGVGHERGLSLEEKLFSEQGRAQLEKLTLAPWGSRRRQELLELLDRLNPTIVELTAAVEREAKKRPEVLRLMTHPGVGPLTALAYVLIIGTPTRFQRGKQIGTYVGMIPSEDSGGGKQRLGHISKQGNSLLRFLLVEAAQAAARVHPNWRRRYTHLAICRHRSIAKVAMGRRLAIRLYWMWRNGCEYSQSFEFGSYAGQPGTGHGVK
jgi:Transposase IS116/IS110/IS902 family